MVHLVLCSDPLDRRSPDEAFAGEGEAAATAGLGLDLISYEDLVDGDDAVRATRRIALGEARVGVYRGWMLSPEKYALLHAALASKGMRLINDPASYSFCHHLPESYSTIESVTAKSVWLRPGERAIDEIQRALTPFGAGPVIVKDYVKSRKHEWREACFIPSASDRAGVERVVTRFLELQGSDLAGGLVFREFVDLRRAGVHPKSGMPLSLEYRVFYLDGQPISSSKYWSEGDYAVETPPPGLFADVAAKVRSRLFAMDVALRADGRWMIVELGDGQVSSLPDGADVAAFYKALAARLA